MPAPIWPSRAATDNVICVFSRGPPFGFVKEPRPNWRTTNYGKNSTRNMNNNILA